jgi:hypothetical protein
MILPVDVVATSVSIGVNEKCDENGQGNSLVQIIAKVYYMAPTGKPRSIFKPLIIQPTTPHAPSGRVLIKSSPPIHQLIHRRFELHQALRQAITKLIQNHTPEYI